MYLSGVFLHATTHQLLLLCYNATSYNIEMTFHVPSGLFLHANNDHISNISKVKHIGPIFKTGRGCGALAYHKNVRRTGKLRVGETRAKDFVEGLRQLNKCGEKKAPS